MGWRFSSKKGEESPWPRGVNRYLISYYECDELNQPLSFGKISIPVLRFPTQPVWSHLTNCNRYVPPPVLHPSDILPPQLTPAPAMQVLSSQLLPGGVPSQGPLLLWTWQGPRAGLNPGSTTH